MQFRLVFERCKRKKWEKETYPQFKGKNFRTQNVILLPVRCLTRTNIKNSTEFSFESTQEEASSGKVEKVKELSNPNVSPEYLIHLGGGEGRNFRLIVIKISVERIRLNNLVENKQRPNWQVPRWHLQRLTLTWILR